MCYPFGSKRKNCNNPKNDLSFSQCGNVTILLPFRFYVKSLRLRVLLQEFKSFNHICQLFLSSNYPSRLISREIWVVVGKSSNFHTVPHKLTKGNSAITATSTYRQPCISSQKWWTAFRGRIIFFFILASFI